MFGLRGESVIWSWMGSAAAKRSIAASASHATTKARHRAESREKFILEKVLGTTKHTKGRESLRLNRPGRSHPAGESIATEKTIFRSSLPIISCVSWLLNGRFKVPAGNGVSSRARGVEIIWLVRFNRSFSYPAAVL